MNFEDNEENEEVEEVEKISFLIIGKRAGKGKLGIFGWVWGWGLEVIDSDAGVGLSIWDSDIVEQVCVINLSCFIGLSLSDMHLTLNPLFCIEIGCRCLCFQVWLCRISSISLR